MSDQDRIFPYNIDTISSRQVMRIKKKISQEITSWSNTKFSKLTSQELHWCQTTLSTTPQKAKKGHKNLLTYEKA